MSMMPDIEEEKRGKHIDQKLIVFTKISIQATRMTPTIRSVSIDSQITK